MEKTAKTTYDYYTSKSASRSRKHTPSDSEKRLHVINIGTVGDGPKRGHGIYLSSKPTPETIHSYAVHNQLFNQTKSHLNTSAPICFANFAYNNASFSAKRTSAGDNYAMSRSGSKDLATQSRRLSGPQIRAQTAAGKRNVYQGNNGGKRPSLENTRAASQQGSPSFIVPAHFIKSYLSTGKSWLNRTVVNPNQSQNKTQSQNFIRLKYPGRPNKKVTSPNPPPPPPPKKVNNFVDNHPQSADNPSRRTPASVLYGPQRQSSSPFETPSTNLFSRSQKMAPNFVESQGIFQKRGSSLQPARKDMNPANNTSTGFKESELTNSSGGQKPPLGQMMNFETTRQKAEETVDFTEAGEAQAAQFINKALQMQHTGQNDIGGLKVRKESENFFKRRSIRELNEGQPGIVTTEENSGEVVVPQNIKYNHRNFIINHERRKEVTTPVKQSQIRLAKNQNKDYTRGKEYFSRGAANARRLGGTSPIFQETKKKPTSPTNRLNQTFSHNSGVRLAHESPDSRLNQTALTASPSNLMENTHLQQRPGTVGKNMPPKARSPLIQHFPQNPHQTQQYFQNKYLRPSTTNGPGKQRSSASPAGPISGTGIQPQNSHQSFNPTSPSSNNQLGTLSLAGSCLQDYSLGRDIGKGAYAIVKEAVHKTTGQRVAIKFYDKSKLSDVQRRKSVRREIKLMEKMNHPNIIKLYDSFQTDESVCIVMELVSGMSLHAYLKSKPHRRLDQLDARRLFRQVVAGIDYCHRRCITHRDIKLENLLLIPPMPGQTGGHRLKIIDFGFSTCIPNDRKIKIFCGTPSYMAPEIVSKKEYAGPPADIWALGVLLYATLNGCFPYRGQTDKELYKKINSAQFVLQNYVPRGAQELLKKIFKVEPADRPSATQILDDSWLRYSQDQPLQSFSNSSSSKVFNQEAYNAYYNTSGALGTSFVTTPQGKNKNKQFPASSFEQIQQQQNHLQQVIGQHNWEPGHFNIINNITQINGPIFAGTPGKKDSKEEQKDVIKTLGVEELRKQLGLTNSEQLSALLGSWKGGNGTGPLKETLNSDTFQEDHNTAPEPLITSGTAVEAYALLENEDCATGNDSK